MIWLVIKMSENPALAKTSHSPIVFTAIPLFPGTLSAYKCAIAGQPKVETWERIPTSLWPIIEDIFSRLKFSASISNTKAGVSNSITGVPTG